MALGEINNDTIYLKIINGTLAQEVDRDTPNAKRRTYDKDDNTQGEKWELYYRYVSGKITELKFKESAFGEQFVIILKDVDDTYQLQMPTSSKYFTDFGKKISNIYLDDEVT